MRIAFLGKGGAGKTTTAAGFVKYAAKKFSSVLAIDADVNAHLLAALNFEKIRGNKIELGEICDQIFDYLRGERTDVGAKQMLGTTPPSFKSSFIRVAGDDPFLAAYALRSENILLLTVGTYKESDVGGSCYHTKLRGLAGVMHHLLDLPEDIVVADTTAGTDNIATSLSFAYDVNVFVVEPTLKSLRVYSDFLDIAPQLAERVFVIGNKIETEDDKSFILNHVSSEKLLGFVPNSQYLKRFEQGNFEALDQFHQEQNEAFDACLRVLVNRKRDWREYLTSLRSTHSKVCQEWYNEFYGANLDENLDTDFSYEAALSHFTADQVSAPTAVRV
ncbi:hypothetical protein KF728_01315 [Candidatus Obscuribacterales bacterium]|nr:hypothetical protein [Candidatus Obscuribacterales bacterium]MBX3148765.1 hypothetical protein [Candidatus Obscuribacterales bacterium]